MGWQVAALLFVSVFCVVGTRMMVKPVSTAADVDEGEETVLKLGQGNFKDFLEKNEMALVEFFAPWCGHCQRLRPEYEAASRRLIASGVKVPLAKVDCTENHELCQAQEIKGYPTLKFFRNGEHVPRMVPRAADGIIQVVSQFEKESPAAARPPARRNLADLFADAESGKTFELTADTFSSAIEKYKVLLVYYHITGCSACKTLGPHVTDAASRLAFRVPVATVNGEVDAKLAREHGVTGYPTVLLFRNGESRKYNSYHDADSLVSFVELEVDPGSAEDVHLMTEAGFKQAIGDSRLAVIQFHTGEGCRMCKDWAPELMRAATKLKPHAVVGTVDVMQHPNVRVSERLNKFPIVIVYKDGQRVAEFNGRMQARILESFVLQHRDRS